MLLMRLVPLKLLGRKTILLILVVSGVAQLADLPLQPLIFQMLMLLKSKEK